MRRNIVRFGGGVALGILAFGGVTASAAGIQAGARREFQPVVTLESAPNGFSACQATAEVYDKLSGRTWTIMYPRPLPD